MDYTPRSIPGKASSPRFKNETCHGLRIRLEDPRVLRPFRLTLALLRAIRRHHPEHFQWTSGFDRLAGGSDLRARIEAGTSARAITRHYETTLRAFDKIRHKLYTENGAAYMKAVRKELTPEDLAALGADRQMLHAESMDFLNPGTGAAMTLTSPPPDDFLNRARAEGLA